MADLEGLEEEERPHDEGLYVGEEDPQPLDPNANPRIGGGADGATWWTGGSNMMTD